jgi:hypothetical protein
VHWHNTTRLHGYLNDLPPTEFEDIFYATKRTDQPLVEIHRPSLHRNQGDSAGPLAALVDRTRAALRHALAEPVLLVRTADWTRCGAPYRPSPRWRGRVRKPRRKLARRQVQGGLRGIRLTSQSARPPRSLSPVRRWTIRRSFEGALRSSGADKGIMLSIPELRRFMGNPIKPQTGRRRRSCPAGGVTDMPPGDRSFTGRQMHGQAAEHGEPSNP